MAPPDNMALVKLPVDGGLVGGNNALVTWHPNVSFDDPLLIVLFFHGLEQDPQAYAWTGHHLPDQLARAPKNAVLIAPTMQVNGSVNTDYLSSPDRLAKLVREGVAAIAKAVHRSADHAFDNAKLFLVGYSNGYLAWNRAVKTLQSTPAAHPQAIGHALFDCLYWSCLLMENVEHTPPGQADFSVRAKSIVDSGFVTTHFTSGGKTLKQAGLLGAMVERHAPELTLHPDIPSDLEPKDVVITHLPTSDHYKAVSIRSELSRLIGAVPGFALPASPNA
jgi:hypothetical protein